MLPIPLVQKIRQANGTLRREVLNAEWGIVTLIAFTVNRGDSLVVMTVIFNDLASRTSSKFGLSLINVTMPFGEPNGGVDTPKLIARASRVFNADQVDGRQDPEQKTQPLSQVEAITGVDAFVRATKADIRHGGEMACYRVTGDYIQLPEPSRFCGTSTRSATESYYGVLCHELTHWTGVKHRLDRELGKRFGDAAYAMEELVAELGAAFLCADLCIASEPRPDHAAYINSWLEVLKNDRKAIFVAASRASHATEFLTRLTGREK